MMNLKNDKNKRISRNGYCLSLLIAILFALHGCASMDTQPLPPVTAEATGIYHEGKVIWHDLLTEDVAAASTFYSGLFGWQIQPSGPSSDYLVILNDAKPIGGIASHKNTDPNVWESLWLSALSVKDVDLALKVVRDFNGKILDGPFDVKQRGRMAIVEDPLGAPLVVLRSSGGDPKDELALPGEWLWTDLFTQDAEKAKAFYAQLVGYESRGVQSGEDHVYHIFFQGKRPRAGLVVHQWKSVEANWLPYVKVDDIDAMVKKARKLNGKLIMRKADVAVLMDPTGAAFGIQYIGN